MAKHAKKKIDPDSLPYEVGKWKTAVRTRFPPGHKINVGRKKKSKEKTLDDILNEKVKISQPDGKVIRMSNREIILRQVVAHARKGSLRHAQIALEHDRRKEAGESDLDPLSFDAELRKAALKDFAAEIKTNLELGKKDPKDDA